MIDARTVSSAVERIAELTGRKVDAEQRRLIRDAVEEMLRHPVLLPEAWACACAIRKAVFIPPSKCQDLGRVLAAPAALRDGGMDPSRNMATATRLGLWLAAGPPRHVPRLTARELDAAARWLELRREQPGSQETAATVPALH